MNAHARDVSYTNLILLTYFLYDTFSWVFVYFEI